MITADPCVTAAHDPQFTRDGFCVLKQALAPETVARMRQVTCANLDLMGQTRASDQSYHLAGFHRFSALLDVERALTSSPQVQAFMEAHFRPPGWESIGLTDITVNRSQHWHTDLLRGAFSRYLDGIDPWASRRADCVKALAYLQDGKSLRIVPGSHFTPTPLDDLKLENLAKGCSTMQLDIEAGDVVMMDIRALHRGSTDQEMANPALSHTPKILASMVFGQIGSTFSQAMRTGNSARMQAWDQAHLPDKALGHLAT